MGKQAVIFDLDGTLWDTSEQVVPAWNRALEKHSDLEINITLDDMYGFMGKTISQIAGVMFPDMDETKRINILNKCCKEEELYLKEHGGTLYDGLYDMLEDLYSKYDLYIVSNCQDGYLQTFLEYHKTEKYFKDYEMAGRTGLKKGENIKLVISRNQVDSAIYVGDTISDMEAAKEANIPFIYAEYGFGNVDVAPYKASTIKDIVSIVNEVFKANM